MYILHCTTYRTQCTVYRVQCTIYKAQCTVYRVHCTIYRAKCIQYPDYNYSLYRLLWYSVYKCILQSMYVRKGIQIEYELMWLIIT